MAGFNNETMYANNVDFTGSTSPTPQVTADGQLLIGSSTTPHIRVSTLTAGTGVSITNGHGSITVAASAAVPTTFTEDSGTATPSANNINILGTSTQGISTSGSGATVTITASNASTTQKGVVALATNAETIAGTDTDKAVTPDDLKAKLGTQTVHSLALFQGTSSAMTPLGAATNGQIPIGSTGADPVLSVPNNGNNISWSTGAGSLTANLTGTTNHAIQLGNSSGSLTSASVLTNGQLLIGSTGSDPVAANITSSGGTITVTNGAGTINLEAISAGITATVQTTDATQTTLASISVAASSCVTVKGTLAAAQSDFSNGVGGDYIITARRTGVGSATIVGVTTNNVQSSSAATFTCDVDAGTNSIRVRVTGVAATTYNWKTTYQTVVQS